MKPSTPTKLLAILMLAVTGAAIGPKPESDVRQDKAGTAGAVAVPLPVEKTNCVRCHLTAGRELTVPVYQFARSVHDRAKMSCNDCHGGNTADDATAHEHEFGFIGTKLSAHIGACADCHMEEADLVQKGAHFWDVTKRINRDYPLCIDCHGNHDVGKPPTDFSMMNVCTDCHKDLRTDNPEIESVIANNDRLWQTLRRVHAITATATNDPTPGQFRSELNRIRRATARLVHDPSAIPKEQAESLNVRVRRLREQLEAWLIETEKNAR